MIRNTPSVKQDEETPRHPLTDQLSPFVNGRRRREALVMPTASIPGIGHVVSVSQERDKEGNPVRAMFHLVGLECLHWAPSARETGDCRFGCIKRGAAA